MKSNYKYRVSVGLTLAALMVGGASVDAFAQVAGGGCFTGPAKMSDADISSFTSNPGALLTSNVTGGLPLSGQVRGLSGSSSSALDSIIGLVSQANEEQKSAIGAGLARAARSCQAASPAYVQSIQEKVAGANDRTVTSAFLAGMSEVQTSALGGAGGAGAGAGGGGAAGIAGGNGAAGATGTTGGDNSVAQSGGTSGATSRNSSFTAGTGGTTTNLFSTFSTTIVTNDVSPSVVQ